MDSVDTSLATHSRSLDRLAGQVCRRRRLKSSRCPFLRRSRDEEELRLSGGIGNENARCCLRSLTSLCVGAAPRPGVFVRGSQVEALKSTLCTRARQPQRAHCVVRRKLRLVLPALSGRECFQQRRTIKAYIDSSKTSTDLTRPGAWRATLARSCAVSVRCSNKATMNSKRALPSRAGEYLNLDHQSI